jgi:peptidyl-prolyl cis-trans isomerase SurA
MTKIPSLILATTALSLASALAQPVQVNGIAASVNGSVVTKNEVGFMLAPIYAQLSTQYPRRGPEFEKQFLKAQKAVLQELIDRRIILDEFKQQGMGLRAEVIDQEVKRQIRELYNGSESKLREELKANRLTMDRYREITREKMVVQAMKAQQFDDAPPPLPNEIQNEYNEIKLDLRDVTKDKITFFKIFIPSSDPENPIVTPETQLALAEDIAKQIKAGKGFEEMAKIHSKDAFADLGGLQDKLPRTDLAPEFAAILFDAPEDQIVGPLLDPRGFTIVKVVEKHLATPQPLSEVRQMVEERVRRKKTSKKYEHWIESRRKRAMIDIRK